MAESDLRLLREDSPAEPEPADLSYEDERDYLGRKRLREEVRSLVQDRDERKKYASRLFRLVVGWICMIGLIVVARGFAWTGFVLSDNVLIALISSMSVSVLGLFAIVARYLFPTR